MPVRTQVSRTESGRRACEFDGCGKNPTFGSPGDRGRRFCGPHKEAGHVDVMTKRREFDGCEKQPNFGSPDDGVNINCKSGVRRLL